MSPEFAPVTLAVAWMLDPAEVMLGQQAAFEGEPEPLASTFSLSFQHGYACGRVGMRLCEAPPEMVAVAYGFHLAKSCAAARDPSSSPCLPVH